MDSLETLEEVFIKPFEGLFLKVYLCPAGVPTVGWGHTGVDVKLGMPTISMDMAKMWLDKDAQVAWCQAAKLSPILLAYPDAHIAIADFIYNLGSARYRASTLKRKIDAKQWAEAREQILKWVFGGGKKLPGLVARRKLESKYV